MMDRRGFLKNATLVSAACLMDFREALAWGAKEAEVGKAWKGFPLETLFELGDRARHFAYAAERIHRTISTDTPRSPF